MQFFHELKSTLMANNSLKILYSIIMKVLSSYARILWEETKVGYTSLYGGVLQYFEFFGARWLLLQLQIKVTKWGSSLWYEKSELLLLNGIAIHNVQF